MTVTLTWDKPPLTDDPTVPTRIEIGAALVERRGEWAIVARHDRAARAATMVARILDGTEYGPGFRAVARRVGNEHRVYAVFLNG